MRLHSWPVNCSDLSARTLFLVSLSLYTFIVKNKERGVVKTIIITDKAVRRKAHTPGSSPTVAKGLNGRERARERKAISFNFAFKL